MALKRSISYQWRIFFPLVALLWAVIIVQAVIQYQRESQYRENRLNDDLNLVNSRIIDAYEEDIDIFPYLRFISKYYENSELNGIRITIYDDKGEMLYCLGQPLKRYYDENLSPELSEAIDKGKGYAVRRTSETTDQQLQAPYYYYGVHHSADGKLFVHTAMPFTATLYRSTDVDSSLWIIIITLSLLATFFAWATTRYLSQNVKLLHQFARDIAGGNAENQNYEFANDELGEVSKQIFKLYREKTKANERVEREHALAIKATEDKIKSNRQMSDNINHELKTPVSVIKGYLDTITENPDMPSEMRQRFLGKAKEHMERLCDLLNDLSAITRLENGACGIIREKISLNDMLIAISSELETAKFIHNNISFSFDIPLDCYIIGNYNLIYAMFINLIRNADLHSHGTECGVKYIGEDDEHFKFSFYDNGTGIDQEHLPHLFERFYRVDKGRSRKAGGTGLGLPIVKNTVVAMGGTMSVQNRQEGGLEFIFTLTKWRDQLPESTDSDTNPENE
ncbi:MAG: ATP-binding protein [Muribaculum sp.]|nr:ATP-binding protein [Muribaculaceae bacterium]MCM1080780.1 ATP-binding protein [Muribaculum sp.]